MRLGGKLILGASLLVGGAFAAPAIANTLEEPYASTITIVEGEEEITLTADSKQTVENFLKENELKPENYRNADFSKISAEDLTENGEEYTIYRLTYENKTEDITLPIPEVVKESDEVYVGDTKVSDEGSEGKAVKTIVTEKIGDKSQSEEKLTIVEAPKPKIVLKGTKPIPTPAVARQVSSPQISQTYRENNNGTIPRASSSRYHNYDTSVLPAYSDGLMNILKSMVGKPYVWGGTSPAGFDCSGLVYWAFTQNGISVPRGSSAMYGVGTTVPLSSVQPGDILVQSGHVGVYAGNGWVIHAANPSVGVTITPLQMFMDKPTTAKRVL